MGQPVSASIVWQQKRRYDRIIGAKQSEGKSIGGKQSGGKLIDGKQSETNLIWGKAVRRLEDRNGDNQASEWKQNQNGSKKKA